MELPSRFADLMRALSTCSATGGSTPPPADAPSQTSGCPVIHKGSSSLFVSTAAATPAAAASSSSSGGGGCPVMRTPAPCSSDAPVNPLNMMPALAQTPAPGQAAVLPVERVESTIPDGKGEKWVYPSAQMFYNALVRKGKGDGVDEDAMEAVVAIHNNMNESTWKQVLAWEDRHTECMQPRTLKSFMGRPDELSPKAACKYYLGLASRPFDRHDWIVDRCGKEVRYIIDYYDVASARPNDRLPVSMHEEGAVPSISIDVRPAGDSLADVLDRVQATFAGLPKVLGTASVPAAAEAAPTAAAAAAVGRPGGERLVEHVQQTCAEKMAALQACDSERSCAVAHIGLMACIAQQVCPDEANAFRMMKESVGSSSENAAEASRRYQAMEGCVSRWSQLAQATSQ